MNQFNAIAILSKRFDVPERVFGALDKHAVQAWAQAVVEGTDTKPFVLANWQFNFLIGRDTPQPLGPSVTVTPTYTGGLSAESRSRVVAHQVRYQHAKSKRLMAAHGAHRVGAVSCLMCRRERMSA